MHHDFFVYFSCLPYDRRTLVSKKQKVVYSNAAKSVMATGLDVPAPLTEFSLGFWV